MKRCSGINSSWNTYSCIVKQLFLITFIIVVNYQVSYGFFTWKIEEVEKRAHRMTKKCLKLRQEYEEKLSVLKKEKNVQVS